ncbi:MAG: DNA recombination protein RmuC [Deltaproteobacteria bacterium]|nr:MAG: DNA recombination protein RmuC [Deltaproteobacteria bacterium]
MDDIFIGFLIIFSVCSLILLIILWKRKPGDDLSQIKDKITALDIKQKNIEDTIKDEIARNRQETALNAQQAREEFGKSLKNSNDSMLKMLVDMTKLHEKNFEAIRQTMENQLRYLREDNTKKLEQMRATVDEKLQSTLEKRLGDSFKQVSERLEQVYTGLGEMRTLATGVGDLKKVLTNVKTRGTWGEIRLSSILEQILTPDQYEVNVATKKNSNERVEFAIKLPGQDENKERVVWMPIDSKFPQEDYQRLIDAQEAADKDQAEKSIKNLEARVKAEARYIKDKYIDPPNTTDFGIMFLPVEGLYAEVLRRPGLCDFLQREYRIVVTGPTTLAALLNSLQMGFRTLAIEKRSSEVWELLGVVKTQFGKFGDVLAKTKKKLQEASNTIDKAEVRTRAIERKLRKVQQVPKSDAVELIEEDESDEIALVPGDTPQFEDQ